jgi:hypothetical protein
MFFCGESSVYEGSLFVVFLSCRDLPNCGALVTPLVPLESPQRVGLHCVGFILFELTGEELLNIEQFFHQKNNHLNQI